MTVELIPLPPEEAIAYFANKGKRLHPSFSWKDVFQDQHAAAFTVAKSAGFDVLGDIHAAVERALKDGITFEQFAKELTPLLQAKGWWGRQPATDPATGRTAPAQLGSPRRLRLIFDVNLRTSYAVGRWAQIVRTAERRPYLQYDAVRDNRTRQQHRDWDGVTLRWDDPWWNTHYPPNGWRCRCSVIQLAEDQVGSLRRPHDGPAKPWTNSRTGATIMVPDGVDPGFAYHVGKAALAEQSARMALERIGALPPALAAAAMEDSTATLLGPVSAEFARWADAALAHKATEPRRVVGVLRSDLLDELDELDEMPASAAITIDQRRITHLRTPRKADKQMTALSVGDIRRLPELLAQPERILLDKRDDKLVYVFSPIGDDRKGKLVVAINRSAKVPDPAGGRAKFTTNEIVNGGLVDERVLDDPAFYVPLWPKQK